MDEGEIEGGSESFGDTLAEGDWMYGKGASMMQASRDWVFVQRISRAIYFRVLIAFGDRRKVVGFLGLPLPYSGFLTTMILPMPGLYYKRNTLSSRDIYA